jgi:hypothetical protein
MSGAQKRVITHALPTHAAEALREKGYTVLPGPVPREEIAELQSSYDEACAHAAPEDVGLGRECSADRSPGTRGCAIATYWSESTLRFARSPGNPAEVWGELAPPLPPGPS